MSSCTTTTTEQGTPVPRLSAPDWKAIVARYQVPSVPRAMGQMADTLLPLAAALIVTYLAYSYSHWLSLALAVPTAGLMVRTFIIMHDCAHGSFLRQRWANEIIGYVTGVLTMTPFGQWRHEHAIHHATSGDLDRRGPYPQEPRDDRQRDLRVRAGDGGVFRSVAARRHGCGR